MQINHIDNSTGTNHSGKHANSPVKMLTASSLRGDKVFNKSGESLGKIKDLMLNISDGTIQYIVIAFGGIFGIGRKFFAVPFDALVIDTSRHAFILDQSKESFENSPGFDKNHWPESNAHASRPNYTGGFMGPNTGSDH